MPRMEMGQFHALSLLLLFYYSRNMDNVDAEALRAYADRYVEPCSGSCPMNTAAISSWNISTAYRWKIRTPLSDRCSGIPIR